MVIFHSPGLWVRDVTGLFVALVSGNQRGIRK